MKGWHKTRCLTVCKGVVMSLWQWRCGKTHRKFI